MASDELKRISDEALRDRSLGLAAIIQSSAESLHKIHTELWRRYKQVQEDVCGLHYELVEERESQKP